MLATGGEDGTVRLWDPAAGARAVARPLTGHRPGWGGVAGGRSDGRPVLATGGDDGTVRLWDPAAGQPVGRPLTGHTAWWLGCWGQVGRPAGAGHRQRRQRLDGAAVGPGRRESPWPRR